MATTNIPIYLTPIPVPVGVEAIDINGLLSIIAEYMTGQISQNVSFFIQGTVPPTSNQGIFYNTNTKRFEDWNSGYGAYTPISELQVGDMKAAYRQSDDVANGWVLLNGRAISSIVGITQIQKNNLDTLFPSAGTPTLPNLSFISGLSGLPASNAFSGINNPASTPTPGTIGALSVSSTYQQAEVQALRNNTETLSSSVNTLQLATASIQSASNTVLQSLLNVNSVTGPKWFVFCGYPS